MRLQEDTWNHKCLMRTQAIMVFIHNYKWQHIATMNGHTVTDGHTFCFSVCD